MIDIFATTIRIKPNYHPGDSAYCMYDCDIITMINKMVKMLLVQTFITTTRRNRTKYPNDTVDVPCTN